MITLAIIHEAQNKDVCAQRILFDCYGRMLFKLARRYITDPVKAEDAVAEAVFIIFQKMNTCQFVAVPPFEMWIKRIVVNECLKVLKKEKRFEVITEAEEDQYYVDDSTIEQLSVEEIFRVIEELPAGYRTIFNLYEVEGYKHSEIAEMLGISIGTSKSQLSKAKPGKKIIAQKVLKKDRKYKKHRQMHPALAEKIQLNLPESDSVNLFAENKTMHAFLEKNENPETMITESQHETLTPLLQMFEHAKRVREERKMLVRLDEKSKPMDLWLFDHAAFVEHHLGNEPKFFLQKR